MAEATTQAGQLASQAKDKVAETTAQVGHQAAEAVDRVKEKTRDPVREKTAEAKDQLTGAAAAVVGAVQDKTPDAVSEKVSATALRPLADTAPRSWRFSPRRWRPSWPGVVSVRESEAGDNRLTADLVRVDEDLASSPCGGRRVGDRQPFEGPGTGPRWALRRCGEAGPGGEGRSG